MNNLQTTLLLSWMLCTGPASWAQGPASVEELTAIATVKTSGGAPAHAPMTVTIDRKTSDREAKRLDAGSGTLAPAAKITLNRGAFVVQDYASEVVWLSAIARTK